MILRLTRKQVANSWDIIEQAIYYSFPPTVRPTEEVMNNVIQNIYFGKMDVWAACTDKTDYKAIFTTIEVQDIATNQRNLLVYSVYGFDDVSDSLWKEGIETLVKYGKSRGYEKIIAYTKIPYIVEKVVELGGQADWMLVSFDLR